MIRHIFYITEDGLDVYSETKKPEDRFREFLWRDKALIDAFIVQLTPKDEVFIVLDLIDEELNFEWTPKVFPWEKPALLKRRMERLLGDNVALAEIKDNRAFRVTKEGRKEELILSASVHNHFNLTSFLAKLERANVLLREIYSKPFLLKAFFEHAFNAIQLPSKYHKLPVLITTRQKNHVYRQTFIIDGILRLSRLVEIDHHLSESLDIQNALLDETRMAISYIYNQKILPFKAPLGLVFFDSDEKVIEHLETKALDKQLILSTWSQNEYFFASALFSDLMGGSKYCNQPQIADNHCFSAQAMVDFIFTRTPKGFYQNAYAKKIQNIFLGRKLFLSFNTLLFLGFVGYLLVTSIDSYLKWQELGILDERIVAHETEKQRLESLVKLKDDAQTIKSSVEFSESILKLKLGHLAGFDIQALSDVLVAHPNIHISNIEWSNKERFDSHLYEVAFDGWVFPFYGTYEKPVKWVDDLVTDLQKIDGMQQVTLTKEPLNRKLNEAVTINTDKGKVPALPFSITLRLKDGQSK